MVMMFAVRGIIVDVEFRGEEWSAAGCANEAGFVVAACETAVGGGDGFAFYGKGARFAVSF